MNRSAIGVFRQSCPHLEIVSRALGVQGLGTRKGNWVHCIQVCLKHLPLESEAIMIGFVKVDATCQEREREINGNHVVLSRKFLCLVLLIVVLACMTPEFEETT